MSLTAVWLLQCLGLSGIMALAWLLQYRSRNAGWADVAWSFGTGLTAILMALTPLAGEATISPRRLLVAILVAIWSLRLTLYIRRRTLSGPEDARYAKLRDGWGAQFQSRLFGFLQIQALAAFPLILTIGVAAHNPATGWRIADSAGAVILAIAILGEAIADDQLRHFKATAAGRGQICDIGLWRWSRHPNYFFEWLGWLAYPVIAIDFSGQYLWGWAALGGPLIMYWLLVFVSGIPPLEEHLATSRGEAFQAYRRRTSAFIPLPPRNSVS